MFRLGLGPTVSLTSHSVYHETVTSEAFASEALYEDLA